MNRTCGNRPGRPGNRPHRLVGILLMLAGVLLLMVCLPYWLWTSILAVLLILAGYFLYR